ncbi:MAG TPA: ABC transporter ATP-binding protein, partial [Gemmatimonadetes bacterium]|nr:ABC transporter ATP-binding protein [Gemmatimonadota bacterium]
HIFAKLQRLDLRFYDQNPVGRLMTRITSDVETLNELFSSGVVAAFGDLFTLGFILSAMLYMDWRLALITFSVLPFVVLTAFLFRARLRTAYRDIRVRLARINAYLHERITGIVVIKPFSREEHDARRHAEINQDYLEAHLRSITYYALFFPVIELFTAIALALIIWRGAPRCWRAPSPWASWPRSSSARVAFSGPSRISRRSTTCFSRPWRRPSESSS